MAKNGRPTKDRVEEFLSGARKLSVAAPEIAVAGIGNVRGILVVDIVSELEISDVTLGNWLEKFGISRIEMPDRSGYFVPAGAFQQAVEEEYGHSEAQPEPSQLDMEVESDFDRLLRSRIEFDTLAFEFLRSQRKSALPDEEPNDAPKSTRGRRIR